MCHQYGISALVSWTLFCRETSGFFSKLKLAVLGAYLTVMGESPFLVGRLGGGGGDVCGYFLLQNKVFHDFFPQKEGGIDPIQKWLLD